MASDLDMYNDHENDNDIDKNDDTNDNKNNKNDNDDNNNDDDMDIDINRDNDDDDHKNVENPEKIKMQKTTKISFHSGRGRTWCTAGKWSRARLGSQMASDFGICMLLLAGER